MKPQLLAFAAAAVLSANAMAAVTVDEAKQLGTTLTKYGAIKAANKDGSIPEYTGGLTKPPADFKAGSGFWADPFKGEKPILRIDAKNYQQYADKLSDGQKEVFKRDPSFYMDIYPSHRRHPGKGLEQHCAQRDHVQDGQERPRGRGSLPRRPTFPDSQDRLRSHVEPAAALQG